MEEEEKGNCDRYFGCSIGLVIILNIDIIQIYKFYIICFYEL